MAANSDSRLFPSACCRLYVFDGYMEVSDRVRLNRPIDEVQDEAAPAPTHHHHHHHHKDGA